MIDKTNLRIETVNEYCIVDEKNQIIKDGFCSEEEAAKWFEDAYGIKHEPKPQPKIGGWIPSSERLPEVEQTVLLSLRSLDVSVGFRANTDGYFYTEGEGYVLYENVLAWQPLPEAYHG